VRQDRALAPALSGTKSFSTTLIRGLDNLNYYSLAGSSRTLELRRRLAGNYFCLLFFSSGSSMLPGGDEFLRTQGGNNNAYCQDNPLSWFD
jgi:pullulanase/glycogen debranching enzyme